MANTAPDLLSLHAMAQPDKVALIEDPPGGPTRSMTFAELEEMANRIGGAIATLGIAPGARVLWCGPNSPRGHGARPRMSQGRRHRRPAQLPADPRGGGLRPRELRRRRRLRRRRVRRHWLPTLPTAASQLEAVYSYRGRAPDCLDGDALFADATPLGAALGVGSVMIYTSGTTGKPKGALRAATGDPAQVAALDRPDRLHRRRHLPHHRAALSLGTARIRRHRATRSATPSSSSARFDPEDWLRLVTTHKVSTTFSAPTPIRMVCSLDAAVKARYDHQLHAPDDRQRRALVDGAQEALPGGLPRRLALGGLRLDRDGGRHGPRAPTTTCASPGSCGKPAPGITIKLFDDDGNEVTEPGVPGELYVQSPSMFQTYHKAEDKYDEDRRGDFHTVGDIAYFDDEGYFYICDRKKDMIISGGMNIYPAEIEAALEAHPDIYEAAVFAIPSEEWGEAVHAVVVRRPGAQLSEARRQRRTPANTCRTTRCHDRSPSSRSCRGRVRARSSSASCASPSGSARTPGSVNAVRGSGQHLLPAALRVPQDSSCDCRPGRLVGVLRSRRSRSPGP